VWSGHFNFTESGLESFRGVDELNEMVNGIGVGEEI
jgi:hypothetical protein